MHLKARLLIRARTGTKRTFLKFCGVISQISNGMNYENYDSALMAYLNTCFFFRDTFKSSQKLSEGGPRGNECMAIGKILRMLDLKIQ